MFNTQESINIQIIFFQLVPYWTLRPRVTLQSVTPYGLKQDEGRTHWEYKESVLVSV